MSDEAVKKQIEGVCEEISEKNDWVTFNINVGRQYPVRLSTKLDALIKAGREAKNNKAVWTFSESQGGENPNKPGTHYINRRLEKVEVGGALDPAHAAAGAAGGGSGGGAGPRSPEERHSIERQTIIKAALPLYERKFEGDDDFFAFAEKLATFVAKTGAAATPPPAAEPVKDPAWPDTPEDDIPF